MEENGWIQRLPKAFLPCLMLKKALLEPKKYSTSENSSPHSIFCFPAKSWVCLYPGNKSIQKQAVTQECA